MRFSLHAALLLFLSLSCFAASAPPKVLGYERSRSQGGDWQAEAGAVLISELSCAACHHEGPKRPSSVAWKQGPDLAAAGDRLRASFVRSFLANPASKSGTTMPDLLAGYPEAKRAEMVEDLTHYVMSLHEPASAKEIVAGSAEKGRELFHRVGCVACHSDLPLEGLGQKYAPGQLARFLSRPLKARPAGRMPDLHLRGEELAHLAAFLSPDAPVSEPPFVVDGDRARRGQETFNAIGCANCHSGAPGKSRPLKELDLAKGCLTENPEQGLPRYTLNEEQRVAIRTALEKPRPKSDAAEIRHHMLQRNCFACHSRGGQGGPKPEIALHFTSAKDDLGDLGRLPPPLDGAGRKFQPTALESILRGKDPVRKYMHVRMPDFGDDLARELATRFAKADLDPNERPATAHANPNQVGRNEWGRELVGTSGYACIACHDLHGHASLGLGAYDMAEMAKRLRPEWMRDFLLNPVAFPTGSRMPAFWPGGKPVNPKLGGGNAERQIDSIRVYLTEADQSLPPEGFADKAAFELKPAERPIIFRAFIAGTGTHAIAVGFPGGVNAVFDALASRWSIAWRGRFLDADGTWNMRQIKMEKPLGEDLIRLEETGILSIEGREDLRPMFRGYRVDKDGVPTFEYELGPLQLTDRVEATSNRGLRRTARITGQTREVVKLATRPPAGVKLQAPGGTPLPQRLEFRQGAAEIVEEISW